MAAIEEVSETTQSQSQERLMDAEEIEQVAEALKRPTARMQLESLAKKLRKEAAALKVVEGSASENANDISPTVGATTAPVSPKPAPVTSPQTSATNGSSVLYSPIDRFAFDAGGHDDKFVTLYVPLPGVGEIPKDNVTCQFEKASFDLIIKDLKGKSYRLKKNDLEHDIVPEKSKIVVKADKIVVKLAKVKSEYGTFDYWSKLTDPKRKDKAKSKADPSASLTELMKEMYDNGDDNMRKMIGETMMKQQRGELGKGPDGMGLSGMDSSGLDDL